MSKLRFAASFANSSSEMAATYRVEPTRPDSSAPHQAKRTRLAGLMPFLAIWMASSRLNAEPEPLSLMPGPSGTESRCEPTIVVLSGLPVGVSAEHVGRLARGRSRVHDDLARRRVGLVGQALALGVGDADGRDRHVGGSGCRPARSRRACRRRTSVRPGSLPWLKMIAPDAPASCGVDRLHGEVAGTALDQRDVAGGEAGEVGRLAARASTSRSAATRRG